MKTASFFPRLVAIALVVGLVPGPRGDAQDSAQEEPETELVLCMERLEQALKAVRRNLKDESTRPEALRAVLDLALATVEARGHAPALAAKLPEAERAAFVADYRRMMIDMQRAELDLEAALLDGEPEAIQKAFDAVRDFEDRGHERFTEDEE